MTMIALFFVMCLARSVSAFEVEHKPHRNLHDSFSAELHISGAEGPWDLQVQGVDDLGHKYTVHPERTNNFTIPGVVDLLALRHGRTFTFVVTGRPTQVSKEQTAVRRELQFQTRAPVAYGYGTDPTVAYAPPISYSKPLAAQYSPGWTWWSQFPGGNNSYWSGSLMVDEDGVTRWYVDCYTLFSTYWPAILELAAECGITGTQTKLESGNLLVNWNTQMAMISGAGVSGLAEVTPLGQIEHIWVGKHGIPADQAKYVPSSAIMLDAQDINHDIQELPNGNWMLIAFDDRLITLEDCPQWTAPQNVSGNIVLEFQPYTGITVKSWSTFDAIDVCQTYPGKQGWPSPEWIHLNAFDVHNVFTKGAAKNELILSSFSLGWIYAVRYDDDDEGPAGSLKWIAGRARPGRPAEAAWLESVPRFELAGAVTTSNQWQAGQHDVNIVSADGNTLLMFDNGAKTGGKTDTAGGHQSRLVELDISARPNTSCFDIEPTCPTRLFTEDQTGGSDSKCSNQTFAARCRMSCKMCANGANTTGTTKITFQYGFGGKSAYLGGARKLPNGNFLGQWGALTTPACDAPCEVDTSKVCMNPSVVEVNQYGQVVFSMYVGGYYGGVCYGWNGYRAYRLSNSTVSEVLGKYMSEF